MSFTGFWSLITFEMEPGHPYVGLSLSEIGSLIAWNEFFGQYETSLSEHLEYNSLTLILDLR